MFEKWDIFPFFTEEHPDRYLLKVRAGRSDLEVLYRQFSTVCQPPFEFTEPEFNWGIYLDHTTPEQRQVLLDWLEHRARRKLVPAGSSETPPLAQPSTTSSGTSREPVQDILDELNNVLSGMTSRQKEEVQEKVEKEVEKKIGEKPEQPPVPLLSHPPSVEKPLVPLERGLNASLRVAYLYPRGMGQVFESFFRKLDEVTRKTLKTPLVLKSALTKEYDCEVDGDLEKSTEAGLASGPDAAIVLLPSSAKKIDDVRSKAGRAFNTKQIPCFPVLAPQVDKQFLYVNMAIELAVLRRCKEKQVERQPPPAGPLQDASSGVQR